MALTAVGELRGFVHINKRKRLNLDRRALTCISSSFDWMSGGKSAEPQVNGSKGSEPNKSFPAEHTQHTHMAQTAKETFHIYLDHAIFFQKPENWLKHVREFSLTYIWWQCGGRWWRAAVTGHSGNQRCHGGEGNHVENVCGQRLGGDAASLCLRRKDLTCTKNAQTQTPKI